MSNSFVEKIESLLSDMTWDLEETSDIAAMRLRRAKQPAQISAKGGAALRRSNLTPKA